MAIGYPKERCRGDADGDVDGDVGGEDVDSVEYRSGPKKTAPAIELLGNEIEYLGIYLEPYF